MKNIKFTLLFLFVVLTNYAQIPLSLDQAIVVSREQSLDAFKAKNTFLADYWSFQSYKSEQKPHLTMDVIPVTFNNRMVLRYDYDLNMDIYRQQQTVSSYVALNLSQNIVPTGGKIYMMSNLNQLHNSAISIDSWSSTPIQIGINQPLFAHNKLKWQKLISPLEFERAKQKYLQSEQENYIKTVKYYFDWLTAKTQQLTARSKLLTADTLYQIGVQRYEIASIQKEDLLNLELSKFNSQIELAQAEKELKKSIISLKSFLSLNMDNNFEPIIPIIDTTIQIDPQIALELAKSFNPEIIQLKTMSLEAERDLDEVKKSSRLSSTLNASIGFNQAGNSFKGVYINPLQQQMISLSVRIPLLDWGDAKGRRHVALSEKEVADIEIQQALIDFEQKVMLKVVDFNLQIKVVESAKKARDIAQQSFNITKQRFIIGKADVLKMTASTNSMQSAQNEYISSLRTYWEYYYEIQSYTLYNFKTKKLFSTNFEKLINN